MLYDKIFLTERYVFNIPHNSIYLAVASYQFQSDRLWIVAANLMVLAHLSRNFPDKRIADPNNPAVAAVAGIEKIRPRFSCIARSSRTYLEYLSARITAANSIATRWY